MSDRDRSSIEVGAGYSTISENELLSKLVPFYDFSKPQVCQFWERGVNDTYQLTCNQKTYSLRVYRHGLRTLDAIDFEVEALNHLHRRGVSVAYPIARKDGKFVTRLQAPEGLRYAIVTDFAHGAKPDYEDPANAGLYGQAVAQLHNHSDDFITDHHRPRLEVRYLLDTSLEVVRRFLSEGSDELEFLNKTADELRLKVVSAPAEGLDIGFCHGDCHGYNVHKYNGIFTHYDFDCCGMGLRVFDLATFKWCVAGNKDAGNLWSAFLATYRESREIDETNLDLIDSFVAIRHIWWVALRCGNAQDFGNAGSGKLFVQKQIRNMKRFREMNVSTGHFSPGRG